MGEKFKIKRNTITNERPRYVAHYVGKNTIKRKSITNECCPLCKKKKHHILREKPSQMNVAHYVKKKENLRKKTIKNEDIYPLFF
jgi:hypothetical protein